jgi:AraC-like DNA-binding protein
MLYLIARFAGTDEARRIAKIYLIDPHLDGQMTYASLTSGRQHEDQLISEAQVWAAQHYDTPSPVAAMAERSGMTERGFHRRFKKATGQAPGDYVQTLRIEEAKQLLETTATPIDEVAAEVGYSEPSSFRIGVPEAGGYLSVGIPKEVAGSCASARLRIAARSSSERSRLADTRRAILTSVGFATRP